MADATCSVCKKPAEPDNRLKAGKHIKYCYQWARRNATSQKPCTTPECGRAEFSRGLCNRCYQRAQRGNDPAARAFHGSNSGRTCSVEWCTDPAQRLGWCTNCYAWSRYNDGADPTARRYRYRRSAEDIMALVAGIEPDPVTGCRDSTGTFSINLSGYPTTSGAETGVVRVTRFVLAQKLGRPMNPRTVACHTCDNPPCVEQAHLWEGTTADNMSDRDAKGRGARGVGNARARLDEVAVRDIRARYLGGTNQHDGNVAELASQYGVKPQAIRAVATRRTWAHVK